VDQFTDAAPDAKSDSTPDGVPDGVPDAAPDDFDHGRKLLQRSLLFAAVQPIEGSMLPHWSNLGLGLQSQ
jgi:hypothetical protein